MKKYAIGLDYGTNSCRSLLIDLKNGRELGSTVFPYPSGAAGILTDPKDPNVARQNPQDYIDGLTAIIRGALEQAKNNEPDFDASNVVGIGIDTTGSTIIPVNEEGTPLAFLDAYKDNLNAKVWLWKDHTAHEEAALITKTAEEIRPQYLAKCGGTYSSEWFWSKILHLKNIDAALFEATYSFVEHCDFLPALLTGNTDPATLKRGICAAGHKAMYSNEWNGLPDKEFLCALDPGLADLRDRLYEKAVAADQPAGQLSAEWADKLGLTTVVTVSVGAFDCHMGAVGAGIREGTLTKILGTSTCDMMVVPNNKKLADIPGLCGIVEGSIMPGYFGLEAGQSAVGDIFLWFVNNLVPDSYGKDIGEKFQNMENELAKMKPGETGLLSLDWNNGNRTILVDVQLTGLLLGQTLHTKAHEIYRALIEATAFGALTIIKRIEDYGVPVNEVINTGGLSIKNETLMQIYADILGRPLKVSASEQTCALGAALFGATAAGAITLEQGQKNVCQIREKTYEPIPENQAVYVELYTLYRQAHDAFGTAEWSGTMSNIMKDLITIRQRQRNA